MCKMCCVIVTRGWFRRKKRNGGSKGLPSSALSSLIIDSRLVSCPREHSQLCCISILSFSYSCAKLLSLFNEAIVLSSSQNSSSTLKQPYNHHQHLPLRRSLKSSEHAKRDIVRPPALIDLQQSIPRTESFRAQPLKEDESISYRPKLETADPKLLRSSLRISAGGGLDSSVGISSGSGVVGTIFRLTGKAAEGVMDNVRSIDLRRSDDPMTKKKFRDARSSPTGSPEKKKLLPSAHMRDTTSDFEAPSHDLLRRNSLSAAEVESALRATKQEHRVNNAVTQMNLPKVNLRIDRRRGSVDYAQSVPDDEMPDEDTLLHNRSRADSRASATSVIDRRSCHSFEGQEAFQGAGRRSAGHISWNTTGHHGRSSAHMGASRRSGGQGSNRSKSCRSASRGSATMSSSQRIVTRSKRLARFQKALAASEQAARDGSVEHTDYESISRGGSVDGDECGAARGGAHRQRGETGTRTAGGANYNTRRTGNKPMGVIINPPLRDRSEQSKSLSGRMGNMMGLKINTGRGRAADEPSTPSGRHVPETFAQRLAKSKGFRANRGSTGDLPERQMRHPYNAGDRYGTGGFQNSVRSSLGRSSMDSPGGNEWDTVGGDVSLVVHAARLRQRRGSFMSLHTPTNSLKPGEAKSRLAVTGAAAVLTSRLMDNIPDVRPWYLFFQDRDDEVCTLVLRRSFSFLSISCERRMLTRAYHFKTKHYSIKAPFITLPLCQPPPL